MPRTGRVRIYVVKDTALYNLLRIRHSGLHDGGERWIGEHGTLGQTPAGRWAEGVAARWPPRYGGQRDGVPGRLLAGAAQDAEADGFMVDYMQYFGDALKPWIACQDRLEKFVLRRDPRDISRIWVLDPDGHAYLPVPYRTLSCSPISVLNSVPRSPGCAVTAAPRSMRTPDLLHGHELTAPESGRIRPARCPGSRVRPCRVAPAVPG